MADARTHPAESSRDKYVLSAIIAVGLALRLWQYLADTSMWFDELSIARNVGERSLSQLLTQPLGFQQTAPIGFLAAIRLASVIFGPSDMSLRLFPFLCGIAGLFLFRRVAERTLEGIAVPIAVALFAFSAPLIRYTAELKQYGCDVLAVLVLTLVAVDLCRRTPTVQRCIRAGMIGVITIFFSQAAVLVLAGVGAALALRFVVQRDEATRRPALVTVPIWACAALGGFAMARHYTSAHTMDFMHWFWRSRLGFLPLPFTAAGTALWTRDRFVQFFDAMSAYPAPMLYTLFSLVGFAVLWRRRDIALILLGPVVITFAAAVAQQYPFRTRVVLFLLPALLLSTAAAMSWIVARVAGTSRASGALITAAMMVPPIAAIVILPPPYTVEPFKPVFAYVQSHRRPGDRIYVYANSYQAITRYGAQFGMQRDSYVTGACDEKSFVPFLADVDRFRGEPRLWVIGSSVPDFRPGRRAIGKYLRTIGVARDSMQMRSIAPMDPVSAELFDLSDTLRLQTATAESFHVAADTVLHALCFDWVVPTPVATLELR